MHVSQDMFPPSFSPILISNIREGSKTLFTDYKGPKAKKHSFGPICKEFLVLVPLPPLGTDFAKMFCNLPKAISLLSMSKPLDFQKFSNPP